MAGTELVVVFDVRDRVAMVTLNRPGARDALSRAVTKAPWDAVLAAEVGPAVDAVILTGADPACHRPGPRARRIRNLNHEGAVARPVALAQAAFVELAVGLAGQFVHEIHAARALVGRQLGPAAGEQLGLEPVPGGGRVD